ncbi:MAG: 4,5-DOPA dioxygenase extradiol [Porphyromonadaceae bacterium]|nr:4,5-DOPA dioxygenase extradiol [Porphyromonadaceae bacterium]
MEKNIKMPVLFVGHGNPMNAIQTNVFTETWRQLGKSIPTPKLILCISAHWETRGTHITAMPNPKTIHDFGGFPKELYEVQYPAPGFPLFAEEIRDKNPNLNIGLDTKEWGFDHGSWTVIKHIYPDADIPMIQLSIDYFASFEQHYKIAKQLTYLRKQGVLIVGSGNIVHNLRTVDWHQRVNGYEWANEVREQVNQWLFEREHDDLISITQKGESFRMAIPTSEHYIPLLYTIAMQEKDEQLSLFNDKLTMGSLSMTGVKIG